MTQCNQILKVTTQVRGNFLRSPPLPDTKGGASWDQRFVTPIMYAHTALPRRMLLPTRNLFAVAKLVQFYYHIQHQIHVKNYPFWYRELLVCGGNFADSKRNSRRTYRKSLSRQLIPQLSLSRRSRSGTKGDPRSATTMPR